ncbi:MAG: HPr(Ser) kinase/phosphatase [Xanthomonadales bacterium]|nr:HPr(Ser) kinase/phosphatase [Xanthomonadales bacterium]
MNQSISAAELFRSLKDRLQLSRAAGPEGENRAVAATDSPELRPSLCGFLNLVHPNDIQVLGLEELRYLDSLDSRKRWETIAAIIADKPVALIVSDDLMVPDDLAEGAEESRMPLWRSPTPGVDLVGHVQHYLARRLARSTTVHGVFMEVFSIGVLITGDSGSGKSELALELITRGHRLIADDAPVMTLIPPDVLDGTCPELLQDCLEVRGLGVLNVRAMFGDSAIKQNKYLKLVVHLDLAAFENAAARNEIDRLHGDVSYRNLLGIEVPVITIPVAPGRNIAVIVEAAVRNHNLKLKGYDAAAEFLRRHEDFLTDSQE